MLRIFPSQIEPGDMSSFKVPSAPWHFSDFPEMTSCVVIPSNSSATRPRQRTSTSDDASLMWSANLKLEVPSFFFVYSALMASMDVGLQAGNVWETSNCMVNVAGAGFWRHSSIMDSPLFLISWAATSGLLVAGRIALVGLGETPLRTATSGLLLLRVAGRIALVGLGGTPLWIRVACPFNSPFISYASNGKGVKDDLIWTDMPV
mmetsp:Transcript_6513/g.11482  ORF Transcript_6513/g.11482 Transcript_6513/m.11482 type:complete len:205 (-) Transcript_6513:845-1459(-)